MKKIFEQHYASGYSAILDKNNKQTPFLKCLKCKKKFSAYKYSIKQNRIYQNTSTNITKHDYLKKKSENNQKLNEIISKPLSSQLRSNVAESFARELILHPTVSVLSGVEIMNSIAKKISNITYSHRQVFDFDITRQYVSSKIFDIGWATKKEAKEFLLKNIQSSCIIVDHWSHNGVDYIGIVGKTFKNFSSKEYLIALEVSDSDKTSIGINGNVVNCIGL